MEDLHVDNVWDTIDIGGFEKLCQSMDRFGFTVKANVTTIAGYGQLVGKNFSSPCRNSIYTQTFSRSYGDTGDAAIQEVHSAMKQYDPTWPFHQWVVEGFAGARLFTDGVAALGASPTRSNLIKWLDGVRRYTAGGLLAPTDYQWPYDYSKPAPECFSIAQWQDSATTFVERTDSPLPCYGMPW